MVIISVIDSETKAKLIVVSIKLVVEDEAAIRIAII